MSPEDTPPIFHVLLVGIDQYPPGYNSLAGCVNDIEAVERLLLEPPGVIFPPERVRVTRLAAPRAGHSPAWQSPTKTLAPTKANLIQALQHLAGPEIRADDRVLIYYAGHGDQKLWAGSMVWHEAVAPHNGHQVEYLFDVEMNRLIDAIAARTSDLTIVIDACHSAGATRDIDDLQAEGTVRALNGDDRPVEPPDLSAFGLDSLSDEVRSSGRGLLQRSNPDYLVVVACQSDEKASEGADAANQATHGVFTHSLLSVLNGKSPVQRVELRWADIWSELLESTARRSAQLRKRTQHPWLIGRSERRVFGGAWEKTDPGYSLVLGPDGSWAIGAGSLMGVTAGAEIAVYGAQPRLFPPIGSAEDRPLGRLVVVRAGPSSAVAHPLGEAFPQPEGARGRLVRPGQGERLRLSLKPAEAALSAQLDRSPLLEILPPGVEAEVEVSAQPDGGWVVGNEVEPAMAIVPAGEAEALRLGLEHYYRYNTALRLARRCSDPQFSRCLGMQLLDCNDAAALAALSDEQLADPVLPEARRDAERVYSLRTQFEFCVRVTNFSSIPLNVTLFNCSAGGLVEYLSDALLRAGAAHVMWLDNRLGRPFRASPDKLPANVPGIPPMPYVTDRLIAIGATRRDVDLKYLAVDQRLQQVVDENLSSRAVTRGVRSMRDAEESAAVPAELWTATITPVRIMR